jgi:broad specificity phosphatase PhoE
MAATTLHLIRHASHDLLGRVLVGRAPVPISAAGEAEAAALAQTMGTVALGAVISSPQLRARQTATAIGGSVCIEPGLDEIDFGDWTGMRFDALAEDPRWRMFDVCRSRALVPGGETMLAAQARAVEAVLRIGQAHAGHDVALVSHGDIIKAILVHMLGMSLDLMQRIELAPASRSIVVLYDDTTVVQAINLPLSVTGVAIRTPHHPTA